MGGDETMKQVYAMFFFGNNCRISYVMVHCLDWWYKEDPLLEAIANLKKGTHLNHWTRMIVGEAAEFLFEPPAKDTCWPRGPPVIVNVIWLHRALLNPSCTRIHPGIPPLNNLQQLGGGPSLWYYILYEISLYRCFLASNISWLKRESITGESRTLLAIFQVSVHRFCRF